MDESDEKRMKKFKRDAQEKIVWDDDFKGKPRKGRHDQPRYKTQDADDEEEY